jgi:putative glutamine amidotransferase
MSTPVDPIHIGIYGPEEKAARQESRGCSLWEVGYTAAVTHAGGAPVLLGETTAGLPWDEILKDVHGIVFAGSYRKTAQPLADETRLVEWCRKRQLPLLCVDNGLHVLNTACGGTLYADLAREVPEALQHRHPPEKGLRHAINVLPKTRLADIYGEGELVVNSEHRQAVCKVAKGFRVCAQALDGVTEAIEAEGLGWFAVGVQWRPASASASGLDIQLFRGLVEASKLRLAAKAGRPVLVAA